MAAAKAAGVHLEYTAIEVEPGDALNALARMRSDNIRGYSVTMPHKEAVIPGLDELTSSASALGAVNHITNTNGHLVGNNTDGDGFVLGYEHAGGRPISGANVCVLGSGGAARAIIEACHSHGAAEVVVIARSPDRANVAAQLAADRGRVGSQIDLGSCDVLVNATPIGMAETPQAGELAADVSLLPTTATVADIVYNPLDTPLLQAASQRGLQTVGGVTMLVGQAAKQFSAWTGVEAPLSAMFAAVSHVAD